MKIYLLGAAPVMALTLLAACGETATPEKEDAAATASEYERGPHRGRMLRSGPFALEITIFEDGVDPEFRVYAYRDDKPVKPTEVALAIELGRLGGRIDRFSFTPQDDFLRGSGIVAEPHSFDVRVVAREGGRRHKWSYAAYEGRTAITAAAAKAGGVKTEAAGPATISDRIDMGGRIEITPEGKADVRARLPGLIVSLDGNLGQQVRRGQLLARVESSHSLQVYPVTAPIGGTIIEKNVNVGDTTGDRALFVIADPAKLHAEFFVYPRDAERIRVGQAVTLKNLSGEGQLQAEVEAVLPTADVASQTMMAHVHLPPIASRTFRPGMGVEGSFAVAQTNVPIAVRTKAIQRFRDFEVVFARVGDTYEVRMLEIGRRTPEWTEVLGGLRAGEVYVTDGAFLIRADIEKSGASHDH
ncbi:HlyD family efflux transporter periplasmic adaptor subunit [Sphingopyxis sp. PAMC25046]|uniref:efflux RND transporter periplasmic adaptor subunit n=1 Tax=Sphingopyxis sp. PAMC25046 TaxID=2565556 RepID=UPI00109DD93D|nr:HlyD family efflux transporter periplasmic adaptor subunit [Sphingopyxis sp. PAMC25046]QCB54618.1 HlyD family efflux transporter periplasmic adaptor subunit [Sphingopyxis sp. PAMC25046]